MKRYTLLAGVSALALLAAAITFASHSNKEAVSKQQMAQKASVAQLGNQVIAPEELIALLATLPLNAREQLHGNRAALENLIRSRLAEKVLLQQAESKGWNKHPEVIQQIRAAHDQVLITNYLRSVSQVPADYPSVTELQQVYNVEKSTLKTAPLFRVSQIFIATPDPQSVDAARKQASELAKKTQEAPDGFAALATERSQEAESAAHGGDIGLLTMQQLLPEVRAVVDQLKVGEVSDPVQSAAGFHVIKLTERQPSRQATFDEVRAQLTNALRAQRQEQLAKDYLANIFNTTKLNIDSAHLNKFVEPKT